tara:strand:- start:4893 stop:5180 length:288 start_codon:yes stop_codon:yes gene_type:complete
MNDIKEKFQEIERLSSKIDVILESISFWETRMNKCFDECDEIEENQWLPNLDEKTSNLRKEMQFILNKVNAEERELDILDEGISKLYKEIISSEI